MVQERSPEGNRAYVFCVQDCSLRVCKLNTVMVADCSSNQNLPKKFQFLCLKEIANLHMGFQVNENILKICQQNPELDLIIQYAKTKYIIISTSVTYLSFFGYLIR